MSSTPILRRGLPRTEGGAPWPTVGNAQLDEALTEHGYAADATSSTPTHTESSVRLRQGLPRLAGGAPWPPVKEAGIETVSTAPPTPAETNVAKATDTAATATTTAPQATATQATAPQATATQATAPQATATETQAPAAPERPAHAAGPESKSPSTKDSATPSNTNTEKNSVLDREYGPFSARQWLGGGALILGGIILVAAIIVLSSRWFLSTDTGANFIADYDGHPGLPDSTPTGIPAWLSWQHFLNFFFMALIVKTGISIRYERKAPAYWAPKNNSSQKMSLTIWIHLVIDLLWIINGAVFFVLLFATGHWARIVPTSLDIFPHAASAALQYASLDWPTENGWVHYNGLQLLFYFVTVFIVAPMAIATGFRMSAFWPKSEALNRLYPISIARKLHFPIALYFAVFIVIHVLMVFATGALRNLNHMWAAQGDPDPTVYAGNWTGFIFFVIGLALTTAAAVLARPMVLAPVARLFGTVTAR